MALASKKTWINMLHTRLDTVIFDLGGVLVDWSPYHLYRKLLPDDESIERFLDETNFYYFLKGIDSNKTFKSSIRTLAHRYPDSAKLIEAYWLRWPETIKGPIDETVKIVRELDLAGIPLYVISNWSSETWHHGQEFDFLKLFKGIVISGLEGIAKPDIGIFNIALNRYHLKSNHCLFVDDRGENVIAAKQLGMQGHRFTNAQSLRAVLLKNRLLSE